MTARLTVARLEELAYASGERIELDPDSGRAFLTVGTVVYVAEVTS